jgi:hypothetical protein
VNHVDTIRRAVHGIRTDPFTTVFVRQLADLLEAAANREAAYLAAPHGDGDPQPGEEITLAWSIAAAWLGEPAPFAKDGAS